MIVLIVLCKWALCFLDKIITSMFLWFHIYKTEVEMTIFFNEMVRKIRKKKIWKYLELSIFKLRKKKLESVKLAKFHEKFM